LGLLGRTSVSGLRCRDLVLTLGLHRVLVFFSILTAVVSGILLYLGIQMMTSDLKISESRILRQQEAVKELIQSEIEEGGGRWNGH